MTSMYSKLRRSARAPLQPIRSETKKKINMLEVGSQLEVRIHEEGFENSWFAATLCEVKKNYKLLVEYRTIKTDDGKEALREEVNLLQIRPEPEEVVMVNPFRMFDRVNAKYNDGWWEGQICAVLGNSKYKVYFESTDEIIKFHESDLRIHQEWYGGKWSTPGRSPGKKVKPELEDKKKDDVFKAPFEVGSSSKVNRKEENLEKAFVPCKKPKTELPEEYTPEKKVEDEVKVPVSSVHNANAHKDKRPPTPSPDCTKEKESLKERRLASDKIYRELMDRMEKVSETLTTIISWKTRSSSHPHR